MLVPSRPTLVLGRPVGIWLIGVLLAASGLADARDAWHGAAFGPFATFPVIAGAALAVWAVAHVVIGLGLLARRSWAWAGALALTGLVFVQAVWDAATGTALPSVLMALVILSFIVQYLVTTRAWFHGTVTDAVERREPPPA